MLLNELSATEAAKQIATGKITSEALIRACLDRIERREKTLRAWATIDPNRALREARARDRGPNLGPLHGVPIGVKDVIDTADMPTEMGSPIYSGYRPFADASCVALVRAAGAVILGKTVTAEFAGIAPGPTTNPYAPAHTPGGSSSGSAAAVADFMTPVAFGTQTGGSVLRPASYCGVIGYKPTFGMINRAGIKFAAESLDTIGLLTRTVEDVALVLDVLVGRAPSALAPAAMPPRVGLCRTYLWHKARPETMEAVEAAGTRLAAAGAHVRDVALPDGFEGLSEARETINNYERSRAMAYEWAHHRDRLSPQMIRYVELGFKVSYARYVEMLRFTERCRERFASVFRDVDVLIAPSATGEAPEGLASTGDTSFQAFWTPLHVPTMSLPTHRGPQGLPVGIQLIGQRNEDARLLQVAAWIWTRLGPPREGYRSGAAVT